MTMPKKQQQKKTEEGVRRENAEIRERNATPEMIGSTK